MIAFVGLQGEEKQKECRSRERTTGRESLLQSRVKLQDYHGLVWSVSSYPFRSSFANLFINKDVNDDEWG